MRRLNARRLHSAEMETAGAHGLRPYSLVKWTRRVSARRFETVVREREGGS